jgi:F0F1-type ATP synthase gamma subunit
VAVSVTSDKGLCGGLNSTITKYTKVLLQMTPPGEAGLGSVEQKTTERNAGPGKPGAHAAAC